MGNVGVLHDLSKLLIFQLLPGMLFEEGNHPFQLVSNILNHSLILPSRDVES